MLPIEVIILSCIKLAMVASAGGFAILGMKLWLKNRDRHDIQIGRVEFDQLSDAVENLLDQTSTMREEFQDLHERIDFAERLLAQQRQRDLLKQPEATPV